MENEKNVVWAGIKNRTASLTLAFQAISMAVILIVSVKAFELVFGNTWSFAVFILAGFALSFVNIPLYRTQEKDIIYMNLGGGFLPVVLSVYLLYNLWAVLNLAMMLIAIVLAIVVSYFTSSYRPGSGIRAVVNITAIVSAAAVLSLSLFVEGVPTDNLALRLSSAYIASTLGALIGADLLNLHLIGKDGRCGDRISIGGAGPDDGVWLVGFLTMFCVLMLNYVVAMPN